MYILYFDGASKNNPGVASYGGVIYDENNNEVTTYNNILSGKNTNNYAEYYGLLKGLEAANKLNIKNLEVYGDSNLVVQQMNGKWKVKSENLIHLYNACKDISQQFTSVSFHHVLRKYNKRADELANQALK